MTNNIINIITILSPIFISMVIAFMVYVISREEKRLDECYKDLTPKIGNCSREEKHKRCEEYKKNEISIYNNIIASVYEDLLKRKRMIGHVKDKGLVIIGNLFIVLVASLLIKSIKLNFHIAYFLIFLLIVYFIYLVVKVFRYVCLILGESQNVVN